MLGLKLSHWDRSYYLLLGFKYLFEINDLNTNFQIELFVFMSFG